CNSVRRETRSHICPYSVSKTAVLCSLWGHDVDPAGNGVPYRYVDHAAKCRRISEVLCGTNACTEVGLRKTRILRHLPLLVFQRLIGDPRSQHNPRLGRSVSEDVAICLKTGLDPADSVVKGPKTIRPDRDFGTERRSRSPCFLCHAKGWMAAHSTTEKQGQVFLFAESGLWNRFGAYAVHVALLTILFGGFLTAQLGNTGSMPLSPGQPSNLMSDTVVDLDRANEVTQQLPFRIHCTDIQQKLIKKDGSISAMNTIDWMTR